MRNDQSMTRTEGYLFDYPSMYYYQSEEICLSNCYIGIISLTLYYSILSTYDSIEKIGEIKFLNSLYAFRNANQRTIEKMYKQCVKKYIQTGDYY